MVGSNDGDGETEFNRRTLLKSIGGSSGLTLGTGVVSSQTQSAQKNATGVNSAEQDTCPADLTGQWVTEDGSEWTLDHIGSTVNGYARGDAECDGDIGWVPVGDPETPDLVMEGTFTDNTLTGTQEICYTSADEDWDCYGEVIWEEFELTLSEDGHTLSGYWTDSCNDRQLPDSLTRCGGENQHDPLDDLSTLQSPGGSGWRGAIFGCYRNQCRRPHRGMDFHAPVGTPVKAAVSGRITHRQGAHFGDYIILRDSGSRNSFVYAHLSAREPEEYYCAGDTIGATGISGNAGANRPHLHIEVGYKQTRLDPANFFQMPDYVIEEIGTQPELIQLPDQWRCEPCQMTPAPLSLPC